MGDGEDGKGKRKKLEYEELVESPSSSARRTRPRTTSVPDGQNIIASGNPASPPSLDIRDDRVHQGGGGEQGDSGSGRPQDPEVTRDILEFWSEALHEDSGGVGNLGRGRSPVPVHFLNASSSIVHGRDNGSGRPQNPVVTRDFLSLLAAASSAAQPDEDSGGVMNLLGASSVPSPRAGTSSSQLSLARDDRMTEAQLVATMVPRPRPRAPTTTSAGQHAGSSAAAGASGSSQPRNAGFFNPCPACNNNPRGGDPCLLCGREPRQPPALPPTRQGFPTAPTDCYVARPSTQVMVRQQPPTRSHVLRPRVAAQRAATPNALALVARPSTQLMIGQGQQRSGSTRAAAPNAQLVPRAPRQQAMIGQQQSGHTRAAASGTSLQQSHNRIGKCQACNRRAWHRPDPQPHFCLCDICLSSYVVCPICGASWPAAARQG